MLSTDVVEWAVRRLLAQKIHTFVPAYLLLRAVSIEQGSAVNIPARWTTLGEFLNVPGGPEGKPYYRPFLHKANVSPWLNSNLSGSFSPSSIREQVRRVVVPAGDHQFSLLDGHVELAFEHLLYGRPAPGVAVAAFLFRNYGFTGPSPNIGAAVDALRTAFRFWNDGADDASRLFDMDTRGVPENPLVLFEHAGDES